MHELLDPHESHVDNLDLDDEIDFTMDVLSALENIDDFCCYMPSWPTIKFLVNQLYPNSGNSSLKDKKVRSDETDYASSLLSSNS